MSEDGTGGECADGKGLIGGANAVAVSDDGRHVYVTARGSDALAIDSGAVVVFGRDRRTGALTQLPGTNGCVSEDGTGGECAEGSSLIGTADVAISRDGRHVYVASFVSDAVAVFTRDRRTGALRQVYGVVGNALNGARFLAVSRDGRNVYVTSIFSNAVAVFSRDKWTGVLTQLPGTDGCVSDDGTGGTCANGRELNSPGGVAVSPDGRHVYVASHPSSAGLGAVAVFSRDRRTGALTQLPGTDGCVSEDGSGGECVDGRAIDGAFDVAVTEDGRNVYVVSRGSRAIATFVRDRRTGALTQLTGTDGCVSEDGTGGQCADGRALIGASRVTLSRDGRNVYVGPAATPSRSSLETNRPEP